MQLSLTANVKGKGELSVPNRLEFILACQSLLAHEVETELIKTMLGASTEAKVYSHIRMFI